MSPLFTYEGKLLVVDGKLAANENCCCGDCPEPVAGGLLDPVNFGWTKPPTRTPNSITATFTFEDSISQGCGGINSSQQTGIGTCDFTLTDNRQVTLTVNGNTEDQTPGYDYGWIVIEGPGVPPTQVDAFFLDGDPGNPGSRGVQYHVLIGSTQFGNLCAMFNKNDQLQINLGPGKYIVTFQVNTFDELWHQNMVHNFSVSW